MEATKVSFNPAWLQGNITQKRRRELRIQRVKEFIDSKPNGSVFRWYEFKTVLGFNSKGAIYNFLNDISNKHIITREQVSPRSFRYYSNQNVNIVKPPIVQKQRKIRAVYEMSIAEREKAVIEYINSKPEGTPIKGKELTVVTGMQLKGMYYFLKNMIDKGLIKKEVLGYKSITYKVLDRPKAVIAQREPEAEVIQPVAKSDTTESIMQLVKDYYWQSNGDNDLRKFTDWVNGRQ